MSRAGKEPSAHSQPSSLTKQGSVLRPLVRLLVFDLDGTLIDSSADLCASVNATLHHFGQAELSREEITRFIGEGAAKLVERALTAADERSEIARVRSAEHFGEALRYFLDYYRDHKLDETKPYPGVLDALRLIRQRHPVLPMAVLTNKPVRPSREICDALGLSPFFFDNYGGDSFAKKPDPEGLHAIIAEANALTAASTHSSPKILPEAVVMVGDSAVDIQTARRGGTRNLGCNYGLAPDTLALAEPDLTASCPADWLPLLDL